MSKIIVDIADMAVSDRPGDELITYSLGSCLGITAYDPEAKVGGMMHCMLPLSKVDKEKAKDRPFMFVDTGMVIFLQQLFNMGMKKDRAVIKVAGGSRILDRQGTFRIGERNYTVFRKLLWKNGLMIDSEDVGGELTRTIRMDLNTGTVIMKASGSEREL